MILTHLTLTNFGVFHGRQTAALAPRPSRPIILFGGKNGAGKSTLLEAIRVCLYGPGSLGSRPSKEAYFTYLDGRIHSSPSLLIQPMFASVAVEFQYADTEALHTYLVTRSWERRGAHKLVEHLEVDCDGKPLGELDPEHWQDFIHDLIPPSVSQFFFFDGEKIQHLAEDTSDQQALAGAIKSLLGLDLVERLRTDLRLYLSRMTSPLQDRPDTREIETLHKEIADVQQILEQLRDRRAQQEIRLSDLRAAIARIEAKIASEGGSFTRNRDGLLRQDERLKTRIAQHEDTVRELCTSLLPFALISTLCLQLKEQLLLEEWAAQQEAGRMLLCSAKEELLQRVDAHDFWVALSAVSDALRTEIHDSLVRVLQEPLRVELAERVGVIHQLSPVDYRQLLSWIEQATHEIPKTIQPLADEMRRLSRELHKVEGALRKIPADEVLKPFLGELHDRHQELAEAAKQALIQDEQIKAAEVKLAELERHYNQAAERLAAQATQASRIRLVPSVQNVLEEYKSALLEKKIRQLQETVSDCFNALCRKKDMVRKITVDPKDFSVTLYDGQSQPLPKAQLSAGEKQIYAIAMLWALAKIAGCPLPIIIDTPLARLDSDHRKLLMRYYFPVASHQIIVLSTDTEVDQSSFVELRREVAHMYRLEYDAAEHHAAITPGYFWKGTHETH